MCILIITSTKFSAATKIGIDDFKEMVSKGTDEGFIENSKGKGKYALVDQHVF